jgi:Ca2+-binding RTX toxin-like protein
VDAGGGNDSVTGVDHPDFHDVIDLGDGDDTCETFHGDDTVWDAGGADRVILGLGHDRYLSEGGDDQACGDGGIMGTTLTCEQSAGANGGDDLMAEANGSTSNDTFQSGVGADTVCLATGSDTAYTQSDSDILYVGGAISTYTADCGADGGLTNKSPPATNCTYDASVTCIGLAGWPARP